MEYNNVEYVQDIAFNDICDRMVIATSSRKIIIYKKIQEKSDCLIVSQEKEEKKENKIKKGENIFKLEDDNDADSEKNKKLYSKGFILIDSDDQKANNKNNKSKTKKQKKERSKTPFLKKSTFNQTNNLNLKKMSLDNKEINNEFSDDLNNGSKINLELLFNEHQNTLFQKSKEFEYRWEKIKNFDVDGPVLRIQWANIEYGNLFACSGYNKWIYVFKEEKNDKISEWNHILIKIFSDAVMDISFLPNIYSLRLAALTLDGYLKILNFSVESWKSWEKMDIKIPKISNNGCTCLCCNPSNLDDLTIVIGCKINKKEKEKETNEINLLKKDSSKKLNKDVSNNNSLLKLIFFKEKSFPKIQSINDFSHKNDITDVDWANQNGRTYHMICSTSKDGKFIIWEINLFQEEKINEDNNFFTCKKIFEFNHNKPLWRCSFNESGIIASCIDEAGETFVFLKIGKNKFTKLDIQKTK